MIEISEILYRWQQGMKKQAIATSLGIARNTVKKEIRAAQAEGLTPDTPDSRNIFKIGSILDKGPP